MEILFLKVYERKNQSWIQDDDTSRELSMIGQPPFRATIISPRNGLALSFYFFVLLFSRGRVLRWRGNGRGVLGALLLRPPPG